MSDPFDTMDAKDGFHVVRTEVGQFLQLTCQAYAGGEPANLVDSSPDNASVLIKEWEDPSEADQGACTRLRMVLDAVARYLTTGGQWDELQAALFRMRKVAIGGIVFPGYHYLDGYPTTWGRYEHIFVKNNAPEGVLWMEPDYNDSGGILEGIFERRTLESLLDRQNELVWEGTEKKEKGRRPRPGAAQIQDRRGADHASEPEGGPGG